MKVIKLYLLMYTNIIIDEAEQFNNEFNQAKSKVKLGSNMLGGQSNQQGRLGGNNGQQGMNNMNQFSLPESRSQRSSNRK